MRGTWRMLLIFLCCMHSVPLTAQSATDAIGFWKTEDPKERFVTSIMVVYAYDDLLYGRIIVSYAEDDGRLLETWHHPQQRIETIGSRVHLLSTDIIWGLRRDGSRWKQGHVLDIRTGKRYGCDIWVEDDRLVLRGRLGPFGVRQIFLRATAQDMPVGIPFPSPDYFIPSPPEP